MNGLLPDIHGVIARRMLVNYRVDPEVLRRLLPSPFRPKLIRGCGMAGICLIRLEQIRPRGWPAWVGIGSENAAHRVAVEWTDENQRHEGVYIFRRDTGSWLNHWAGGRIFPGWHHLAEFTVADDGQHIRLSFMSRDREVAVTVAGRTAAELPAGSVFQSAGEASEFFRRGTQGWSVGRRPDCCDGLELSCARWQTEPFAVEEADSTCFRNPAWFPQGSTAFDCALVMRGIAHTWRPLGSKVTERRSVA